MTILDSERFATDLNEIIGIKDSKLAIGGEDFFDQCFDVSLKTSSDNLYCTLIAKVKNPDGTVTSSTLRLDMAELLFPCNKVSRVNSIYSYACSLCLI